MSQMEIPEMEMVRLETYLTAVGASMHHNEEDGTLTVTFRDGNYVIFNAPYTAEAADFVITAIINYHTGQE